MNGDKYITCNETEKGPERLEHNLHVRNNDN